MSSSKPSAHAAFLAQLGAGNHVPTPATTRSTAIEGRKAAPDRKHIGGYFDAEFVETFAVLKARLKMDNSELIKHAIEALNESHNANRAFGGR